MSLKFLFFNTFSRVFYKRVILTILVLVCFGEAFSQDVKKINPDSLVPFRAGSKWGFSDVNGNLIIKPQYQSVSFFYNNRAIVKKHNKYYLINS